MHRRRMYTGEKAKVVAAVWGTELRQFLAALAILHLDNLKNTVGCFGKRRVEEWDAKQPILQLVLVQNNWPEHQRRPLPSLLYKSLYG